MHSLLESQLQRHFGQTSNVPDAWEGFIKSVDDAYRQSDMDRQTLEHSTELAIIRDVTERNRVEDHLRRSESNLAAAQKIAHLGSWELDLQNPGDSSQTALRWSDEVFRILGYEPGTIEVSNESYFRAVHPDDRAGIIETLAGALDREEPYESVHRVIRPDGTERIVHTRAEIVRDTESGRPLTMIGTVQDITECRRAEQRLATQYAVVRVLAESAAVADTSKQILQIICQSCHWDVGALWIVNERADRLRCVQVWHRPSTEFKEFVDSSHRLTFARGDALPGQIWSTQQAAWIADLSKKSGFKRGELAFRLGLHSEFGFPVEFQGEILGVLEFFSAEIREPDNDLMAMFTALGSQIGALIARKRLEHELVQVQKMEAFGQLAGGVAHDFNNVLSVIMGYANLLLEKGDLSPDMKKDLIEIYSAGEKAAILTRQLLTFSRKKQMRVASLDLNDLAANLARMLGRVIGEDIRLECDCGANLPRIQADAGMMEQILVNLALNARDAMPRGGRLVIGTHAVVLDSGYSLANSEARVGEFVCLSIQDNGYGMTPEVKGRIFEPFFTTKDSGKGTGLGLATVHGIVKQHQGWIEVQSQVGVGTLFKIFLPASASLSLNHEKPTISSQLRGGSETIFLVEDEPEVRQLTKAILERQGYRVFEAASSVEAFSIWERHEREIDLLLTDIVMPDSLTGRELAKQLRVRKPDLRVIYASGYGNDMDGTESESDEAHSFLQKPFHPEQLVRAVRKSLDD